MIAQKFGLTELERYQEKVGFKKSDVRTIKGVCAIVVLPVTVVPEAQQIIATLNQDCVTCVKNIANIRNADAEDEVKTKEAIAELKAKREARKQKNLVVTNASVVAGKSSNTEIVRLQKLLKNFA